MAAAVQEDVDVLGVSILSGAHMTLLPRVVELMRDAGARRHRAGGRRRHPRRGRAGAPGARRRRRGAPGHAARPGDRARARRGRPARRPAVTRIRTAWRRIHRPRPAAGRRGVDLTTWPPRYDAAYRPAPGDEHWLPEIECADPVGARRAHPRQARGARCARRGSGARSTAQKWQAAGVSPDTLRTLDDLGALPGGAEGRAARGAGRGAALRRLPLHRAARTWRASTAPAAPPAGPPCSASARDDWRAHRRGPRAHPVGRGHPARRPRDDLLVLQPVPGLVGRARRRRAAGRHRVPLRRGRGRARRSWPSSGRATSGRPRSTARRPTRCTSPRRRGGRASTRRASASASSSSPASRARASRPPRRLIEQTFGGICVDMGSMAEMSPWMTNGECRHRTGMHLWQDLVYTQVCDPETFAPLPYGAEGTPVYTHLERTSQPMIRLVSGDRARWVDEPCPCGRTYPRLPARPLRPLRRHDHRARRERLPERHRGHPARHRRLRRRVPRDRLAPRGHGRAAGPRRVRRRATPAAGRRWRARCASGCARASASTRVIDLVPAGHAAAHRVQGPAGRRRPRSLPLADGARVTGAGARPARRRRPRHVRS